MSYSNRSHTYASFESLPRENENPTPWGTELLRNFVRDVAEHLQEERASTSDENKLQIGKIVVFLSREIGKDNYGTVIYEGRYDLRPVAVKCLPRRDRALVKREIEHLLIADQDRNIVRYHAMESLGQFYYLAVELCDCNLDDFIQIYSADSVGQFEFGNHPFGEPDERDRNIKSNNKKNLFLIRDFPEAFHLISRLLEADPKMRPNIAEVLQHPMFWDAEKRLNFLHDTSDFLHDNSEEANNNDEFWNAIENTRKNVFGGQWDYKVDRAIIGHGRQFIWRDFNFRSVPDLLRLIWNMFNHRGQLPSKIQTLVGVQYEKFDDYFTSRFPNLLIEVYEVVCQGYKEEVYLKKYFEGNA